MGDQTRNNMTINKQALMRARDKIRVHDPKYWRDWVTNTVQFEKEECEAVMSLIDAALSSPSVPAPVIKGDPSELWFHPEHGCLSGPFENARHFVAVPASGQGVDVERLRQGMLLDHFGSAFLSTMPEDDEYEASIMDRAFSYFIKEGIIAAAKRSHQVISNTEILMFVMGFQGGTVHQVAEYLHVSPGEILTDDYEKMQELMRTAQKWKMMNK